MLWYPDRARTPQAPPSCPKAGHPISPFPSPVKQVSAWGMKAGTCEQALINYSLD